VYSGLTVLKRNTAKQKPNPNSNCRLQDIANCC